MLIINDSIALTSGTSARTASFSSDNLWVDMLLPCVVYFCRASNLAALFAQTCSELSGHPVSTHVPNAKNRVEIELNLEEKHQSL